MNTLETLTRAQLWLATPYKALRHGASLTTPLYNIMRSGTCEERTEASRLYQRVQTVMSQIRTSCPYVPKDCYRVAFLPVATYDDETGETHIPTDYLQYPEGCTLAQRLQLQYAEAERHFVGAKEPAAEEQPTNTQHPAPNTQETAPVPSESAPVPEGSPEDKEPTNTQHSAPNTQETAPVPSDSSEIEEPILRRRRKSAE